MMRIQINVNVRPAVRIQYKSFLIGFDAPFGQASNSKPVLHLCPGEFRCTCAAALTRATVGWLEPMLSLCLPTNMWGQSFAMQFAHAWPVMSRQRQGAQAGPP